MVRLREIGDDVAHFAELDDNNVVLQVLVLGNDKTHDAAGVEHESLGTAWLLARFPDTQWVQTSYNNNFRSLYAGIGMTYDPVLDEFVEAVQ
jgi:hypothetical protein